MIDSRCLSTRVEARCAIRGTRAVAGARIVFIHVGAGPVKLLIGVGGGRFLGGSGRFWGRRVCGVAVKAERPQAKPRTNGLEGGVVRAMLVEPGRGNVRNQGVGRVLTTVGPR